MRLLKTHYIKATDSLFIEFDITPLEEARDQFVAISYCWGVAKPDRFLRLQDQSVVQVTANVEALFT